YVRGFPVTVVVDPVTGRPRYVLARRDEDAVWAGGHYVLLSAGCGADPCDLRLVDVAAGTQRVLDVWPSPGLPSAAAVAPVGRRVAVGFSGTFVSARGPAGEG